MIKAVITQVNHKPEKQDDEDLVRIHTASALEVVEVPSEAVESFLAEARERIRKAKDEASGQLDLVDAAEGHRNGDVVSFGPAGQPEGELATAAAAIAAGAPEVE